MAELHQDNENKVGGLSRNELQFASWWVRNRLMLRRWGYGSLIALCVIFWGYAVWGMVDAYVISFPRESRIMRQIAINQQLLAGLESDRPQNVDTSEVSVFNSTANRLDMMVEVTNPNPQWWMEFNYRFNVSGEDTPLRTGYVLPSGKQLITELGFKPGAKGSRTATFAVDNIRWHRIDPNLVGDDYKKFFESRLQVQATNITYDTDIVFDAKRVGQTSFTLVNNGAYGYWNLDVVVRLYRGSSVSAVSVYKVDHFSPGESRDIKLIWPDNLTGVSKTEIIPQVNILNQAVYLPTKYFK